MSTESFMNSFLMILLLLCKCNLSNGEDDYKVCYSKDSDIYGLGSDDAYNYIKNVYGDNCTHIYGNLIIHNLTRTNAGSDPDLSFLKSIREVHGFLLIMHTSVRVIPLTNLRVIRGEVAYNPSGSFNASIFLYSNYILHEQKNVYHALEELDMRNLKIVGKHDIHISSNHQPKCNYIATINWTVLLENTDKQKVVFDPRYPVPTAAECKSACASCAPYDGRRYCWGQLKEQCQQMSRCLKRTCQRCYISDRNTEECCSEQCMGGCTGPAPSDCDACKDVSLNGKCVSHCPKRFKHDLQNFRNIIDPERKIRFLNKCVSKCPTAYLEENDNCVLYCSLTNNYQQGSKCISCPNGRNCRKRCNYNQLFNNTEYHLNTQNLPKFENCSYYMGPLVLNENSFKGQYAIRNFEQLNPLRSIQSVQGVIHFDLKDAIFIRNLTFLENIASFEQHHIIGMNKRNALLITNSFIRFIGWKRLKRFRGDRIAITKNKNLCFETEEKWRNMSRPFTDESVKMVIRTNDDCERNFIVCHSECKGGCWGRGPQMCVSCRDLIAGDMCVNICGSRVGYFHSGYATMQTKECGKCHPECEGGCHAATNDQCFMCKNAKEENRCVPNCSQDRYFDANSKTCLPCSDQCLVSLNTSIPVCSGPGQSFGPGGCNKCSTIILNETSSSNSSMLCMSGKAQCPPGYFNDPKYPYLNENRFILQAMDEPRSLTVCRPCDSRCETCTNQHNLKGGCTKCKYHWMGDVCQKEPCHKDEYYKIETDKLTGEIKCLPCHDQCKSGCKGPTSADCNDCKKFRIYIDGDKNKMVCNDTCPKDKPFEEPHESNGFICLAPHETKTYIQNREQTIIYSVVFVVISLLVLGSLIIFICFLRRRAENKNAKMELKAVYSNIKEPDAAYLQSQNLNGKEPNLGRLEIINVDDLIYDRDAPPLGTGAFGVVYKGMWIVPAHARLSPHVSEMEVAIKVITQNAKGRADVQEMLEEAKMMASVTHKHCLRLIGVCLSAQRYCLVSAYIEGGSMDRYLREHSNQLNSLILLSWAEQIANGMAYLEARDIIHRDLATRNVLVNCQELVQITDFGLAKMLETGSEKHVVVKSGRVPIRWLAPETLNNGIYSHKTDVWSYGVTLWEIFTYGRRPYDSIETSRIKEHVLKGARLKQPEICTLDVYMVMVKCWLEDPDSRPTFLDLMRTFSRFCTNPGRYLCINGDTYSLRPSNHAMSNSFTSSVLEPPSSIFHQNSRSSEGNADEEFKIAPNQFSTQSSVRSYRDESPESVPLHLQMPRRFNPKDTKRNYKKDPISLTGESTQPLLNSLENTDSTLATVVGAPNRTPLPPLSLPLHNSPSPSRRNEPVFKFPTTPTRKSPENYTTLLHSPGSPGPGPIPIPFPKCPPKSPQQQKNPPNELDLKPTSGSPRPAVPTPTPASENTPPPTPKRQVSTNSQINSGKYPNSEPVFFPLGNDLFDEYLTPISDSKP